MLFIIYESKFIPIKIKHRVFIKMLISSKNLRLAWCFREFVSEFNISYPFLIWKISV